MLNALSGSLVLLDMHTTTPSVIWNGTPITGVRKVHVNTYKQHVCVYVKGVQVEQYAAMRAAGIEVKETKR